METLRVYIEILIYMLGSEGCKSTSEIRFFLERKHILEGSYDNRRRKVLNYLNNLDYLGFIERCDNKNSTRSNLWRINKKTQLVEIVKITEKEKNALLLALSFIPKIYKNFKFYKEIRSLLEKSNLDISDELEKIIKNAFVYIPNFFQKSYMDDRLMVNLENIIEDIIGQRFIRVIYKNETKKILPLKIIFYEGMFYLSCLEVKDRGYEYRFYKMSCVKRLSSAEKSDSLLFHQKRSIPAFKFLDELPFPFALEIPSYLVKCEEEIWRKKDYLIFQTQFDLEKLDNGNLKIYLIGLTSKRFYSHLSFLEFKKIYEPTPEMLKALKEKIKADKDIYGEIIDSERYNDLLKLNITEAKRRFLRFKEKFKIFLELKLSALD